MILSLYLLLTFYTNSMGLIILSKCKPVIDSQIEKKGYILKEKSDEELLKEILKNMLLFLIPGYFLRKALKISTKEEYIDRIIEEKISKNQISTIKDENICDIMFSNENDKLSLGKYESVVPYKAVSLEDSMYTKERYPNTEDIDMDFWEEEEKDLKPYLEEDEKQVQEIKKEPMQEYLSSISEEELENMAKQLDFIRKLKKDSEKFLNNKVA